MFKNIGAKKIEFAAMDDNVPIPQPARLYVPEWYKKLDRFLGVNKPVVTNDGVVNRGPKLCVPLLDGLTTGYIAELWQDIEVIRSEAGIEFKWLVQPGAVTVRPSNTAPSFPVPAGHSPDHLAWTSPYIIKTPPGYSSLIIHPVNRFDLPFTTLGAVVDTDGTMMHGKVPFFIREDFEGVIPAGTPLFQVIPFKRDDWVSEQSPEAKTLSNKLQWLSQRVMFGFYKNNLWKKKNYN